MRPHTRGVVCGLICTESACNSGDLGRRYGRFLIRVTGQSDIEHCFPKENPERFRTFLVSPHSRNGLKLESQDDFNQQFSGRLAMTIAHVRRVGIGHSNRVPERSVRHTTTSHVASMVRQ